MLDMLTPYCFSKVELAHSFHSVSVIFSDNHVNRKENPPSFNTHWRERSHIKLLPKKSFNVFLKLSSDFPLKRLINTPSSCSLSIKIERLRSQSDCTLSPSELCVFQYPGQQKIQDYFSYPV